MLVHVVATYSTTLSTLYSASSCVAMSLTIVFAWMRLLCISEWYEAIQRTSLLGAHSLLNVYFSGATIYRCMCLPSGSCGR